MQTVHDPSTSSYYVNEQLYRDLVASFTDWQRDDLAVHDPSERDQFRMLVEKEARLLDQLCFDEWLAYVFARCVRQPFVEAKLIKQASFLFRRHRN